MATLSMCSRSYRISAKRSEVDKLLSKTLSLRFENVGPRLPGVAVLQIKDIDQAQREFLELQALGVSVEKDWD